MSLACPKCGSRFLRDAEPRNSREAMDRLRFISPLRCLDCKHRFVARTLVLSDMKYARCPNCERMDLNGWTGKTYQPGFFMGLKIRLGAKRWRCEYCRINFASFRRRKEVFTFKRWQNLRAAMQQDSEDQEGSIAD
jgi:DNA-directed RNA polymerase subunit RPC12/RpoP